jgi:hypothetical protein
MHRCIDLCKSFLPIYDIFESGLKVWMEKWKSVSDKELPKSAIRYYWCCVEGHLSKHSVPVAVLTWSAERSFSTLRRLL